MSIRKTNLLILFVKIYVLQIIFHFDFLFAGKTNLQILAERSWNNIEELEEIIEKYDQNSPLILDYFFLVACNTST